MKSWNSPKEKTRTTIPLSSIVYLSTFWFNFDSLKYFVLLLWTTRPERESIKQESPICWLISSCAQLHVWLGEFTLRARQRGLRGPEQPATSSYTCVCVLPSLTQMICSNFYIKLIATRVNSFKFSWLLLYQHETTWNSG